MLNEQYDLKLDGFSFDNNIRYTINDDLSITLHVLINGKIYRILLEQGWYNSAINAIEAKQEKQLASDMIEDLPDEDILRDHIDDIVAMFRDIKRNQCSDEEMMQQAIELFSANLSSCGN